MLSWQLVILFLPTLLSGLWLLNTWLNGYRLPNIEHIPLPLLVIVMMLALVVIRRYYPRQGLSTSVIWLLPCFVSPLAVLYPWAVIPTKFPGGVGFGGAGLFWQWMTKYPNFGPVNFEVAAGIAAMLATAFLPAWFATHAHRCGHEASRLLLWLLLLLALIAYGAVFYRLDLDMALAVILYPGDALFLIYGPMLRGMAILAIVGWMIKSRKLCVNFPNRGGVVTF